MNDFSDSNYVINITLKLFLLYNLIRNIELFLLRKEFKKGGLYYWPVLQLRDIHRFVRYMRVLNILCAYHVFFFILMLASLCAAILIIGNSGFDRLLFIPVFISNIVIGYRIKLGWDGSDKLANMLNVCLFITVCALPETGLSKVTLVFIAAQVLLAYATAAISKLCSPVWRNGNALTGVFTTALFGNRAMHHFLFSSGKRTPAIASWMIICVQLLLAFSVLLPLNLFLMALIGGMVFHLLNHVLFKLNRFVFAFLAAYPSLIYVKVSFL